MRITQKFILFICFLLTITPFLFSQEKTAVQIKNESGKAVVMIATFKEEKNAVGLGSGFIVSENGVIITNYHVIDGAFPAMIKLLNGDIYEDISIIDYDVKKDIAVIKIKGWGLPKVELGNSDNIEVGEKVYVIGNPEGLENTVSDGLLSGLRDTGKGYKLHQISAPISHGSSGSPVFSSKGKVIGIASSSMVEGQNLNFSIPINYAKGMISDIPKISLEEFSKSPISYNETFAETIDKLSTKDCLIKLTDFVKNLSFAYDLWQDGISKDNMSLFYASSELIKDNHKQLKSISCEDKKIDGIIQLYILKLNKLIEGNNLIITGFEKNDINNLNKGYAIRELARGELSVEIDRFANLVQDSYPEIRDNLPLYLQTETNPNSPYIGFSYKLSSEKITINKIIKNTPAEKAGLLIDDIIMGIKNGPEFPNIIAFKNFMEQQKAGNSIEFVILRDGEEIIKKVKLAPRP